MTGHAFTALNVLERAEGIAEVEHERGIVVLLLDAPSCTPLEVSGSGVTIWQALGGGRLEVRSLLEQLAEASGIDSAEIEPLVLGFLNALLAAGLVRLV